MDRPADPGKRPCGRCGGKGHVTKEIKGVKASVACGACGGSGRAGYRTK